MANRAASIHARLLNAARTSGEDFNRLLDRFAIERWLYRLSQSDAREQFCLKGAQLFRVWLDDAPRPTRDADFLAEGEQDLDGLRTLVQMISRVTVDDGMEFDAESVTIEEIREEASYGGVRARFIGHLGKARLTLQLDFGFGDVITPGAALAEFPTVLSDLPAPHLKTYPRETAFAEKLDAIAHYGMTNSRMKDYFDLYTLAGEGAIDAPTLGKAIAATFRRRGTPLPDGLPVGLTQDFASDAAKRTQWRAFVEKSRLTAPPLEVVVDLIATFSDGPFAMARTRQRNS